MLPLFAFLRVITWTLTKNGDVITPSECVFLLFTWFSLFLSHSFPLKNVNIRKCCINHSNCLSSEACDQELMKRQSLWDVFPEIFLCSTLENHRFFDFRKTIAFSFITFWWLLRSRSLIFIMTDYDYLVRLRFTLRKKVLNDNDNVNKVHTFEQKSVQKPFKWVKTKIKFVVYKQAEAKYICFENIFWLWFKSFGFWFLKIAPVSDNKTSRASSSIFCFVIIFSFFGYWNNLWENSAKYD